MSWNSFSQTDTVRIPKVIAVKIAQDLLRYDQVKGLVPLYEQQIDIYEQVLKEKNIQLSEKDKIISRLNQQTELWSKHYGNSQREVKKQKVLKWVFIGVGIVSSGYLAFN